MGDKAAHHRCLRKYGQPINPSRPAAFWKYLSSRRRKRKRRREETQLIVKPETVLPLQPSVRDHLLNDYWAYMFFCNDSITQQIKRKLQWMLPWRNSIPISIMQDLKWPPLAVRYREALSTYRWTQSKF